MKIIFDYLSRGSFPTNSNSNSNSGSGSGSGSGSMPNTKAISDSDLNSGMNSYSQNISNKNSLIGIFPAISSEENKNQNNENNIAHKNKDEIDEYFNYTSQCGFSGKDIERITSSFYRVLYETNIAVKLFEYLVEDVHNTLSGKLWNLLNEKYGFSKFLLSMRNTFLMGKGELYQLILDGILDQTKKEIPEAEKADDLLKFDILKSASKLLNLDDDYLTSTITLRINAAKVRIVDFSLKAKTVSLSGKAKYEKTVKSTPIGRKKSNKKVFLCTIVEEDSSAELSKLWAQHVLQKSDEMQNEINCNRNVFNNVKNNYNDINRNVNIEKSEKKDIIKNKNELNNNYSKGALWLPDQKYISKGFLSCSTFECSWSSVRESVTLSHPQFQRGKPTILDDGMNITMNNNNDNNINNSNNDNSSSGSHDRNDRNDKNELSILSEGISLLHLANDEKEKIGIAYDNNNNNNGNNKNESKNKNNNMKLEIGAGHLLLGGLSCVIHADKLGTQVACVGDLGLQFQGAVTVGVSFHGN